MRIEIDGMRVNITAKKDGDKYDEQTAKEFLDMIATMAGHAAGYCAKIGCINGVERYKDIQSKIEEKLEYVGYYD